MSNAAEDFFKSRDAGRRVPAGAWRKIRIPRAHDGTEDGASMLRRCELRYGEDAVRWPTPQDHHRYWVVYVSEAAFAAYQARAARREAQGG